MAEYINREIAINLIKDYMTPAIDGYEEFLRDEICGNILGKLSTVDVVEVVRCKDCKYYTSMIPNKNHGICSLASRHLGDDGFCSEGERRDDGRLD